MQDIFRFEKEKERISRYQRVIDELLKEEGEIIAALMDQKLSDTDLDLIRIKLLSQRSRAERLLGDMKEDAKSLDGEELSAKSVLMSTLSGILDRFNSMHDAVSDAQAQYKEARSQGEAAEAVKRLKLFAEGVKGE